MPSLIDMIKDTVTFVLNQTVHNWEDASSSRFQRPSSELCSARVDYYRLIYSRFECSYICNIHSSIEQNHRSLNAEKVFLQCTCVTIDVVVAVLKKCFLVCIVLASKHVVDAIATHCGV